MLYVYNMERDQEKEFKRKRFLSFIIVLGYLFFGGCEYVIILPTVWDYLQTLGVTEEEWLGFTVSTYSFAAAIAGLIGGRLADKYYQHTKVLVVGSIAFRAIGNFQYLLGISRWNIICARFLCGIGTASGTALMTEVCRTTTVEERTTFLSICNATFQIGILVGPALQFILSYFNFSIFGFNVNTLNAPGLFLGCLWLLYWLASVLLFHNLTEEFREIQEKKNESSVGGKGKVLINITESIQVLEDGTVVEGLEQKAKETPSIYKKYLDEFLTDSFVLLMSCVFALYFSQIAFETVIPVITQDNFGFGVNENTLIYMAGGIEALLAYVGVAFIGKYVRETTLQLVGWLLLVTAQLWLIIVIPNFEKGNQTHMVYFLIGMGLIYLGSPIASVGNIALSSKVLSNETQGLGQGVRRLVVYVGLIFGPTWAGSTLRTPYLFLGVTISLMLINLIMLLFSYKSLRKAEDEILASRRTQRRGSLIDDESTPLLRSIT